MKFLADAQLPNGLSALLNRAGHNCVHTSSLPQGNATSDEEICTLAEKEGRIVITKDADFVNSHLLRGSPSRLLLISTGNIGNDQLFVIIEKNLARLNDHFRSTAYVELGREALIVH